MNSNNVRFQCNIENNIKVEIESYKAKDQQLGSVLIDMLEAYRAKHKLENMFSGDIEKVCEIKKFTFEQLAVEAFRDYIKKFKNAQKKGFTGHEKSVIADKRIAEVVDAIIDHNNNAEDTKDIIYINHSSILNWLRKSEQSLINPDVINRYLRLHHDSLKFHHEKLGINPSHNRDVFIIKKFKK
jgi:broad specificity phosphatase PhoE